MADPMTDDYGFITWRGITLETVGSFCWASADRRWVLTTYTDGPYLARVQLSMETMLHAAGPTPHEALDAAALLLAQLAEQIVATLKQVGA